MKINIVIFVEKKLNKPPIIENTVRLVGRKLRGNCGERIRENIEKTKMSKFRKPTQTVDITRFEGYKK